MSRRRILIGALLGTAALAAIPSAASASATCTYDQATRTMNVRYGAADTNLTLRNGSTLLYSEAGGFLRSCFSTTGVAATPANTDKVIIKAASGTGPAAQTTTIDESFGGFPESNPNLQLFVFTGTNDRLIIDEGAGSDSVRLMEQGGLAFGPAVDLNYDGKVDLRMTTNNSVVQVNAGNGNDLIEALSAQTYQTVQLGEGGNDVLVGGKIKADLLDGGPNDDQLFAKDGVIDSVVGGIGIDKAQVDFNDQRSGIETPSF